MMKNLYHKFLLKKHDYFLIHERLRKTPIFDCYQLGIIYNLLNYLIRLFLFFEISKNCQSDSEDNDDFSTPADDEGKEKLKREEEEKKMR